MRRTHSYRDTNGRGLHPRWRNHARRDGKPAALELKSTPTVLFAPLLHVSGLFGALLSIFEGRPIVLFEKFDVDRWVDAVVRYKIRFASLPPTPMRMVLDARVPREKLAGLLAVRSGTAPLPPDTQREFESAYGVPVLIQYGATSGWAALQAGRSTSTSSTALRSLAASDVHARACVSGSSQPIPGWRCHRARWGFSK